MEKNNWKLGRGGITGALILLLFFGYFIFQKIHFQSVKLNSESRFTLAEVVEDCSINGSLGRKFEYFIEDEKFNFCSIDDSILKFSAGDKILIRYYLEDHSAYEIVNMKVPSDAIPPKNGWTSVPQFSK